MRGLLERSSERFSSELSLKPAASLALPPYSIIASHQSLPITAVPEAYLQVDRQLQNQVNSRLMAGE